MVQVSGHDEATVGRHRCGHLQRVLKIIRHRKAESPQQIRVGCGDHCDEIGEILNE